MVTIKMVMVEMIMKVVMVEMMMMGYNDDDSDREGDAVRMMLYRLTFLQDYQYSYPSKQEQQEAEKEKKVSAVGKEKTRKEEGKREEARRPKEEGGLEGKGRQEEPERKRGTTPEFLSYVPRVRKVFSFNLSSMLRFLDKCYIMLYVSKKSSILFKIDAKFTEKLLIL